MKTYEIGEYVVKRDGQCKPSESDDVQVTAGIRLPVTKHGDLRDDIAFGDRLHIAGDRMFCYWGNLSSDKEYRYKHMTFSAPTWDGASTIASGWAEEELDKLAQAVKTRRAALAAAE